MVIIDGDADSSIGYFRREQILKGEWPQVGTANWLSRTHFPEWESKHLAPHILCLFKKKDNDWTMEPEENKIANLLGRPVFYETKHGLAKIII